MKTIKYIATIAAMAIAMTSCGDLLDVHNPNYFTDDEMAEYIAENPDAENQVLSGLTASLYSYIHLYNAAINGGYSNSGAYESYTEFRRQCQAGDIVEGDALNPGDFTSWYQNLGSLNYWQSSQTVYNYGYYYAPVLKIGAAQKALDFLTVERCTTPKLKTNRAAALTLKAIGYLMLMERYTDLIDVESTTKQGWPIYDSYAYNAPVAPLSVADTWKWINDTFAEAAGLFHEADPANAGFTTGDEDLYDIDCGVCQYYRCRAALDSHQWDIAIEAGKDVLAHVKGFMPASAYGMPYTKLAEVNNRFGVSAEYPEGKGWSAEYPANNNAFFNQEINPETLFGNSSKTSTDVYWSILGLNTLKNGPSGYYQVDKALYDQLSENDCRKACILPEEFKGLNVFTYKDKDTTWFHYNVPAYTSLKWAATCGLDQTDHCIDNRYANSCYLRTSAVALMLAEAYAQSGKDSEAKSTLNELLAARTLPGKAAMTCDNSMSGKSVLDMVKLQWRIEMWGEGDWAFFNRKRWNETFTRGSNHWSTADVPTEGWTWQIPQTERQGNPYWN